MQAAYTNITVLTGTLQSLIAQGDASLGKLIIPADGPCFLALSNLVSMFQEVRDVMTNPTLEFVALRTFPYRAIGGSALATSIQGALAEIQEVRS
jgi:hypothetical protein